jgi:hypothetical protein
MNSIIVLRNKLQLQEREVKLTCLLEACCEKDYFFPAQSDAELCKDLKQHSDQFVEPQNLKNGVRLIVKL